MNTIGIIILVILLIFLVLYPFKVIIYNQDNYLFVNIAKIINLKLNLLVLFDNNHNEDIKKQVKGLKVIKKIKFKEIDLKVEGLNFNYSLNGAYFGILYALFGFLDKICQINNIKLNYDLKYLGDKSIEVKSVIRARIGAVLIGFYGG